MLMMPLVGLQPIVLLKYKLYFIKHRLYLCKFKFNFIKYKLYFKDGSSWVGFLRSIGEMMCGA